MKKKFIAILTFIFALVLGLAVLSACGGFKTEGTYYLFENEKYYKDEYIILKGKKWSDNNGDSGDYELDGEKISMYTDFFGQKMLYTSGTVKSGILTLNFMGAEYVYAQEGAAHMHEYGDWAVQTPSTCTVRGTEIRICKGCGEYESRSMPLAEHQGEWNIVKEATCQELGSRTVTCTVCKQEITETVQQLDHDLGEWIYDADWHWQICSMCGEMFNRAYHVVTNDDWCDVCDFPMVETEGLAFTLNTDKTGYILTGIGTATDAVIRIPNSYNNLPVVGIQGRSVAAGRYVSALNAKVEKVIIPDSVTSIGNYAFYECSGLTTIVIPNSVTEIGYESFCRCSSLTNIVIPDSVISIGGYAFYDCSSLKNITLSRGTKSIEQRTFAGCSSLTNIIIPDNVTMIGDRAFYDCSSLLSIQLSDNVTTIGDSAFYNTAYYNDENNWESNVLYIGKHLIKAFIKNDYSIRKDTKVIAAYALSNCDELTSIEIPRGVVSIGDYAFKGCNRLVEIVIPDGVTLFGEAVLQGCSGLKSLTVPFLGRTIDSYLDSSFDSPSTLAHFFYSNVGGSLVSRYVPDSLTEVIISGGKGIGARAFESCSNIKRIEIPDSITSIGSSAFSGCTGLTRIDIPYKVSEIGYGAFSGCTALKGVYITDIASWCKIVFNTDRDGANPLLYAGNLYVNGELLTNLIIPNSISAIQNFAFSGCRSIISVEIPNSVTSIGNYAFSSCFNLTSIEIPDSVTSIGACAFSDCNNLSRVTIGSGVTSIGTSAFYNCTSLSSAVFKVNNGWWFSGFFNGSSSNHHTISSADLANPATAATCLTDTYCGQSWKRG